MSNLTASSISGVSFHLVTMGDSTHHYSLGQSLWGNFYGECLGHHSADNWLSLGTYVFEVCPRPQPYVCRHSLHVWPGRNGIKEAATQKEKKVPVLEPYSMTEPLWRFSFNPHNDPMKWALAESLFSRREAKVQRGYVTCLRSPILGQDLNTDPTSINVTGNLCCWCRTLVPVAGDNHVELLQMLCDRKRDAVSYDIGK